MVSQVDIEEWTRIYHIKKEEGILHGSNGMNTVKQTKQTWHFQTRPEHKFQRKSTNTMKKFP